MRALLDTNILIHREASIVIRPDIGILFNWLDRLTVEKWIHPLSAEEIAKHKDKRVRESFRAKLASYRTLGAIAQLDPSVRAVGNAEDRTDNDRQDTAILNELFVGHTDILITEDRGILRKAAQLGIADKVFTIEAYLEKVTAENPSLVDYRVLSAKKALCGEVNVSDSFFDSFRNDYPDFDKWFSGKSQEPAYVCLEANKVTAFLYLKVEGERESYSDIVPLFSPKRRLKIGTFKVELNGFKLGERLLKIVFDNAIRQKVQEIYVTIFVKSEAQERLVRLLEEFGFRLFGEKKNSHGNEKVYVRDMTPSFNLSNPKLTFPYIARASRAFLVPIYPDYHTQLLPDSILQTESPVHFSENEPHRNSIRKVYVGRSVFRDLRPGDTLVFYRTGGYRYSVVTTFGIVEGIHDNIPDESSFLRFCRQRSVFSDDELREHWNFKPRHRPFVTDFLYAYSFPKRPNLEALIKNGVIRDISSAPRGFEQITPQQFETILQLASVDPRIIVN